MKTPPQFPLGFKSCLTWAGFSISALMPLITPLITTPIAQAQLIPDASLGDEASQVIPDGPNQAIEGGAQRGGNLFHSFQEFNVDTGQSVQFRNPLGVEQIITRVTGNTLSTISGTLGVGGLANLVLINPNGIVFTETAQLNLQGAFLATTAEAIDFEGGQFNAIAPETPPLLLVSAPLGVQLGQAPGPIINRAQQPNPTGEIVGLSAPDLTFVGGAIVFDGGGVSGGNVELQGDRISLVNGANLRSLTGGPLSLNAGQIEILEGSTVASINPGPAEGGDIRLNAQDIVIGGSQLPFATVESNTLASGRGGDILINADRFRLAGAGYVQSLTLGSGDGGDIDLQVGESIDLQGPGFAVLNGLVAEITTSGVNPNQRTTGLFSLTTGGRGGDIRLETSGDVQANEGALILTSAFESAVGGDINVNIGGDMRLIGSGLLNITENGSQASSGDLTVRAENLLMSQSSFLIGLTTSSRDGGSIEVITQDRVELTESRGDAVLATAILTGSVFSTGSAGDVRVQTRQLFNEGGGVIGSNSGVVFIGFGGPGGNVTIEASELIQVIGAAPGGLFTSGPSTTSFTSFPAGDLTLRTDRLEVGDGGIISTAATAGGDGGSLTIIANEMEMFGRSPLTGFPTLVSASSGREDLGRISTGDGGDLRLNVNRLRVRDGAVLDVQSFGSGNAGTLEIESSDIRLDRGGRLNAATVSGLGGNIELRSQTLQLRNGSSINTNAGTTDGGNIILDTATLVALENSDITANALEGRGGRVSITAEGIFGTEFRDVLTPDSDITASSELGPEFSGEVQINSPNVNLSAALVDLPNRIADPLIASNCDAVDSRFVVTGRGGQPADPRQPLTGQRLWQDWRALPDLPSQSAERPASNSTPQFVEAQGLQVNESGMPVLIGATPPSWSSQSACQ
ncbi:MAG: Large exoproteins involved in heme utilization or adhesion [Phormidium sp. OSCR]|nr:MAG: Large exoproteins involved in heme utilization or adhesion [Phormidium sp. OSCR]